MNNQNLLRVLVNPFERIAGLKALIAGLIIIVITIIIGNNSGVHFDGVLDIHLNSQPIPLIQDFIMQGLSLATLILLIVIAGIIWSKSFRIIDIIGTTFLARFPFLFSSIVGYFLKSPNISSVSDIDALLSDANALHNLIILSLWGLITFFPIIIWYLIIQYNAYKVSLGISKKIAVLSCIAIIFIGEIISTVLIMLIL
jgi:hypothetical protein